LASRDQSTDDFVAVRHFYAHGALQAGFNYLRNFRFLGSGFAAGYPSGIVSWKHPMQYGLDIIPLLGSNLMDGVPSKAHKHVRRTPILDTLPHTSADTIFKQLQ
jgi:hypothetical protein